MALSLADEVRLRSVLAEVAPQMMGLSGPEQACALGIACLNAGISPTWGEWAAFLREEQSRGSHDQSSVASRQLVPPATESGE